MRNFIKSHLRASEISKVVPGKVWSRKPFNVRFRVWHGTVEWNEITEEIEPELAMHALGGELNL